MTAAVFGFQESALQAVALAQQLGLELRPVSVHPFPDGESLVSVPPSAETALVYRSLDRPNPKLPEILLAAAALRDRGAKRVILVAPYLAYMRQDTAFHLGEAVSQRVIGQVIAQHFDGLVTVDPHLHRIASLEKVIPGITSVNVSAAPALRQAIADRLQANPILVGPDVESRAWVERIAKPLGLDMLIGEKHRNGDRNVELSIPSVARVRGRPTILVDDVISSGATLLASAQSLRRAGATSVEAVATHCLASADDLDMLIANGISRIASTDTVPGKLATISIAGCLAEAIRETFAGYLTQTLD